MDGGPAAAAPFIGKSILRPRNCISISSNCSNFPGGDESLRTARWGFWEAQSYVSFLDWQKAGRPSMTSRDEWAWGGLAPHSFRAGAASQPWNPSGSTSEWPSHLCAPLSSSARPCPARVLLPPHPSSRPFRLLSQICLCHLEPNLAPA